MTNRINLAQIKEFPEEFSTCFFQQYIDKKYEIRSFYFHGVFYSIAILSQFDFQTSIDFRNYNIEKPNRIIPFELPVEYAHKLQNLMDILGLSTGSFDILVDKNDCYYFLEVNPVGRFEMVSYPCNYGIEKYIADYLVLQLKNISRWKKKI